MEFDNDAELMSAIENDLILIVEDVGSHLRDMIKQNVRSIVYDPYTPKMYERKGESGGFLGSWVYDAISYDEDGDAFTTIHVDPDLMELDPPSHGSLHGRNVEGNIMLDVMDYDRRSMMDAMIAIGYGYDYVVPGEYAGTDSNWWTRPRDYWSPSLDYVVGGKMDVETGRIFNKHGIQFKR